MLVLPSPPQRGEGNISNPRVLSDMGLAIPRPTRLGDPRSEPESNSVCVRITLKHNINVAALLPISQGSVAVFCSGVAAGCNGSNYVALIL
jgi:hypothetical protein